MTINSEFKTICIYGVGGVGGYYGGKIAHTLENDKSRQVYFIARGEHLNEIKRSGLLLKSSDQGELICRPALASNDIKEIPDPDLILICVKGYDLDQTLIDISEKVKEDTVIIPLLNGVDIYERIRSRLKKGIVLQACTYVGTHIEKPGVISQGGAEGLIIFGKDPEHPDYEADSVKKLFDCSGIKYEWKEDPRQAIWEKYIFIASVGLVTASSGETLGGIVSKPELKGQIVGIIKEIAAIAEKEGVKLTEEVIMNSVGKAKQFPADIKTSYQRDVEQKGKKNEGDLFGGTIIRLAKKHKIPVPVTEQVYRAVKNRIEGL